jgi:hypothetical protein
VTTIQKKEKERQYQSWEDTRTIGSYSKKQAYLKRPEQSPES